MVSPIPPKPPAPPKPPGKRPPGGPRVSDTRGPNYPKNPARPGETKSEYVARVRSDRSPVKPPPPSVRSSSGGGRRDMGPGSGGAPVSGGRGIVKGLNPPKNPVRPEKADLRDTKGQPIKDRKPVLYSGSGMKRGGTVKGKK